MANSIYPRRFFPEFSSSERPSSKVTLEQAPSSIDNSALLAYMAIEQGLKYTSGQVDQALLESQHMLTLEQITETLNTARTRFHTHMNRHPGLNWVDVHQKFNNNPEKLWSYYQMEKTGGEPDVIGFKDGNFTIFDFSAECPSNRLDLAYDKPAEQHFKSIHPNEQCHGNAVDIAYKMGISILDANDIHRLHQLGQFDRHTWVWIDTPPEIRKPADPDKEGIAQYCYSDEEGYYILEGYPHVLYSARGFRGKLIL